MSQESVREFFTQARSNEALLARLKATSNLDALVQIAKGEGFEFSVADLNAVNPPATAKGPAESQLAPPTDLMGCSAGGCGYTSYAVKCVNSIPQKLPAE